MSGDSDRSALDVLREVRAALRVPEGESIADYARLHFGRSVVACNIHNVFDSLPEGVGEKFIREILTRELAKFPYNTGTDLRVWDNRPPQLADAGLEIPRSP